MESPSTHLDKLIGHIDAAMSKQMLVNDLVKQTLLLLRVHDVGLRQVAVVSNEVLNASF